MKKVFYKTFSVAFLLATTLACSSDDANPLIPDNDLKNYKYTITVDNPIDDNDSITFVLVSAGSQNSTVWKVNNVERNSEQSISLTRNDFNQAVNTYVIETIEPQVTNAFSVQLLNFENDLKFSIKVEVNNEVKLLEENKVLSGNGTDFSRNYTF